MAQGKKLQEGIYHAPGQRPAANLALMFLRVRQGAKAESIYENLTDIWEIISNLRKGIVRSLPGVTVPSSGLTVLIGYGYNIFNIEGARKQRPAALKDSARFLSPSPSGGGDFLPSSGLKYSQDISVNLATEDIIIQFIGDTQLAVNRPIIEIQSYLRTLNNPLLEMASVYHGFNREDGRSWLGFHDGVSNIPSHQRWKVIEIKTPGWTKGGTYLSFIRLGVDLPRWETVSLKNQELSVGRHKLTGCPFIGIDPQGNPIPANGCPVQGSSDIFDPENQSYLEPTAPNIGDNIIVKSHVQRANNAHSADWASKSSLRIYRQGYEFLTTQANLAQIVAGLNFISFQDTPERVIRALTQNSWLGGVNFGGELNSQDPSSALSNLLTVRAAGNFLIPPINSDNSLPGRAIFI